MGVESIRAPELLFQPSMIGSSEAGITETIDYVLKQFSPDEQFLLSQNIFVTGGCANFKGEYFHILERLAGILTKLEYNFSHTGLKERLNREMMQIRPFQTAYNVVEAKNVNLNAWHGAKDLANSSNFEEYLITKSDYSEYGGDYLKEHYASNRYFATPIALNEPSQTSTEADSTNNTENNDSPMKMDEEVYVE